MEGRRSHLATHAQGFETHPHFSGRLDGERHRKHTRRIPLAACARMGDTPGHRTGLARTSTSDNTYRAFQRRRRSQLRIIQTFKQLVHAPHCGKRPAHIRRHDGEISAMMPTLGRVWPLWAAHVLVWKRD